MNKTDKYGGYNGDEIEAARLADIEAAEKADMKDMQISEKYMPSKFDIDTATKLPNVFKRSMYKYSEDEILQEIKEYIDSTYNAHYSREKFQATEFILDGGHGAGFCIGNIMKYAQRYGKKGTPEDARKDIIKIIHYAIILIHDHDTKNKD